VRAVELLSEKIQSTMEGFQKIINIRASMNNGLSDGLKKAFPNTIQLPRPDVNFVAPFPGNGGHGIAQPN
jgi:hypothetical protein